MNASDDGFEWVSVSEAGRRLNLSPSEIRRRIRVGILTGERQPRGPGDTRDRFVVKLPVISLLTEHAQANAPSDASPRADSEIFTRLLSEFLDAKADIGTLREERGRLQAERDNASARANAAEDELGNLRIDLRRAERLAEQMRTVADAQEAKANDLERQLAAARARPWWRRWLP